MADTRPNADSRLQPDKAGPTMGNAWWETQEKVFTRWANTHLQKKGLELPMGGMLRGGLDDGIILWELVAEISGMQDQMEKYNRAPRLRVMQCENQNFSLRFLTKEGVRLVNIGAEDIVDRKVKQILGLIWSLIMHYHIAKQIKEKKAINQKRAKQELIDWLNSVGIPCKNLDYDWVDGKFLCKLVNILRPGLIPADEITDDHLQNAEQAIEKSYDEFEIPKVIDASDMVSENPDELVNMTYLSYFRDKWDELRNAPYGSLIGPNPRSTAAKRPFTFQLQTVNVHGPRDIQVTVKDTATGAQVFPTRGSPIHVTQGESDVWNVEFTPKDVGQLSVDVVIGKHAAKGCPLIVNVTPAGRAKVIGPRHRTGIAKKPVTIQLETEHIVPQDLVVSVHDSKGHKIPASVKAGKDGTMALTFVPEEEGHVTVDLSLASGPVEGAPVTVDVAPAPYAKLLGPPRRSATATKPFSFELETINLKPEELQIALSDSKTSKPLRLPVDVKDHKNGKFTVHFTPEKEGEITVDLAIEDQPIEGAPLTVDVAPAPWARLQGPSRRNAVANKPFAFKLDVVNLKPDELQLTVKDNGRPFPGKVNVKDNKDGSFTVDLTPTKAGELQIDMAIDGKPIEGAPLHVDVDPEPWARLQGPSRRRAVAKKPFTFKLDVVNVPPKTLGIAISDGRTRAPVKLPLTLGDKTTNGRDGVVEVTFTPVEDGELVVALTVEDRPVEGAPLHVDVDPEPWARILGPSRRKAVANKPVHIDLETINLKPQDLHVTLKDQHGKKFPGKVDVKDKGDGVFAISFVPTEDGQLSLDLDIEGRPVEGAPVVIDVAPEPWAKVQGPSRRNATATKPFTFSLDVVNLKPDDLNIQIKDAVTGKPFKGPLDIKDKGNRFDVTFTPEKEGELAVHLDIEGKPVEGAPLAIHVDPAPWARLPKPNRRKGVAKKPFVFNVDVINLKPEELEVSVSEKKGAFPGKIKVSDNKDGTFVVAFVPREPGLHTVDLAIEGKPIEGGPLLVDVDPEPWAKLKGPSRQKATAKKPFTFTLDTVNLQPDNLNLNIKDAKTGKPFKGPIDIKDKGDHMDITFTPEKEGELSVDMDIEGRPVEGAPLIVDVDPAPSARLTGPNPRQAVAKKPFSFDLDVVNLKPDDLEIKIHDGHGRKFQPPVKVQDNKDGTFTVHFTPNEEAVLTVDLAIDDDPIQGAPLTVNVLPAPSASLQGPPRRNAIANRPFNFKLNTTNLTPDDLDIKIKDAKTGKPFKGPVKVVDRDGVFDVSFVPREEGELSVNMEIEGEPIDGSPLIVDVAPEPWAKLVDPGQKGTVGEPVHVEIQTVNVTPYDLDISVKDPTGKPVTHQVKDKGDGTFDLSFIPKRKGTTRIDVKLEGKPIEGSPLTMEVEPAPYARFMRPHEAATAKKPFVVKGETVNVDPEEIVVTAKDKKGNKIIVKVVFKDENFECRFVPKEAGVLILEGLLSGNPIAESPLSITVLPSPSVKLLNPPKGPFKVGSPVTITLKPENAGPDDITVSIRDGNGNPVEYSVNEGPDDTIEVTFVPRKEGEYPVDLLLEGNPVDGFPLTIKVEPKWQELDDLFGDKYSLAPVSNISKLSTNRPVVFNCVPLSRDKKIGATTTSFSPKVLDRDDKPIPCTLKDIGNDVFQLEFVPTRTGRHVVDVKLYGNPIEHSPWPIMVTMEADALDPSHEKEMKISFNVDKQATVGVPFTFEILYQDAEPRLISCDIKDPLFGSLENRIEPGYGDKLIVTTVPKVPGEHKIFGFYGGSPLSGGAIPFFVSPAPYAKLLGPQHRTDGHMNEPYTFQVSTINVRRNQLIVGIRDPDGRVCASLNIDPSGRDTITATFAPNKDAVVHPSGVTDGIYAMTFVPKKKGRYTGSVFLEKKPIENSPFTLEIAEPLYNEYAEGKTQAVTHTSPSAVSHARQPSNPQISPMKSTLPAPQSSAPVQVRATAGPGATASPIKVQPVKVSATPASSGAAGHVSPTTIVANPTSGASARGQPLRAQPITVTAQPVNIEAQAPAGRSSSHTPYSLGDMRPVADTRGRPTGDSYASVLGSSERQGRAGQTLNIEIATKNVVAPQLSVSVSDQFNKTYGARISDNGDRTFTCTFTPSFPGRYMVDIFLDDTPIGGSPVVFVALDAATSGTANYAPRRELARASTMSGEKADSPGLQQGPSAPAVPPLPRSKSREALDIATEAKSSGDTKSRGNKSASGAQTHREMVAHDRPRSKKMEAGSPAKSRTTKEGKSPTTKKKKATSPSKSSTTTTKSKPLKKSSGSGSPSSSGTRKPAKPKKVQKEEEEEEEEEDERRHRIDEGSEEEEDSD